MLDSASNCVVQDATVTWIKDLWLNQPSTEGRVFGFLSIPFDYCVSYRPGTRFGPKAILDQLDGYSTYCIDKRVDFSNYLFENLGSVDISNDIARSHGNIEETVLSVPSHVTPIILGGDHSITDPIFRAILHKYNHRVGLVVFDAHLDCREPVKGKEHSGHWVKTLEDIIDYQTVAQIGINANIYSEQYLQDLERKGVLVVTPYEIRSKGRGDLLKKMIQHFDGKVDAIYFSVDIDVFDQSVAPGTSVPNPSGLMPWEVSDTIFELAQNFSFAGMDITEVSPPLDTQSMTTQVACEIIINFMSGVAKYQ